MRKRYTEQELELIEKLAYQGIECKRIGEIIGVSPASIHHVLSRRNIKFCRNPFVPIDDEIWVDCFNFHDIKISTMGRFLRVSSNSIINGYLISQGYVAVDLSGYGTFSAHRLVAQTFIPNPENKPEVNHKDGYKVNNRVDNLEWMTPIENIQHAWQTGLTVPRFGDDHPRSLLATQEIIACAKMNDEGKTFVEIANIYGVHWKVVSRHVDQYRRSTERSTTIES